MSTYTFWSKTKSIVFVQLLVLLLFPFSNAFASISISVNGQANGASFPQGGVFSWNISGLSNGAIVSNELWIDLNSNGVIDYASDMLFVGFPQQDGIPGGDQGPGDDDGIANGIITTSMSGLYFPVTHYVFKVKVGTDSATSSYQQTALVGPTYSVSGRVTQNSIGKANVTVTLQTSNHGEFYALTNASGDYIITTNIPSGTNVDVRIPMESFNSNLNGLIVSPNEVRFNLVGNLFNVNFTLMSGKIVTGRVTDTMNNPIADMEVQIYPNNGGNGYNGRTDGNGKYYISVNTGTYVVQFGSNEDPKGYIKTYYNQKHVGWMTDLIQVTAGTDTVRNINAVLRKGGVIMGTFIKDGVPVRGNITVFDFNNSSMPLYESWHSENEQYYYVVVPPGTYSVQFNLDNGQSQCYYNQTIFSPGTAVTINAITDTARNINVNFSTLPKLYNFQGWGDWNNPGNWQNNQMPPTVLPSGDYIIIQGGQCNLNGSQTISPGAFLIVRPGATLQVTGNLIRQ